MLNAKAVLIYFVTLIFSTVNAQVPGMLDRFILDLMSHHNIQGLSACIIKDGKMVWAKGYGYANVEKNIPFTPNTIHAEIASLSKSITAAALMQLWEKKLFQLDDPVNNYLPFAVTNPYFPKKQITFRMLLTHSSSLYTNYDIGSDKFDFNSEYYPKLGKFLFDILNPKGSYYIDSLCFHNYEPGTRWNYSGAGYALIGYLVEVISKTSFEEYCNQNIFIPLGMKHTSWHFSGVDTNIVSRPYHWSDEKNGYVDCGLYESPTYPEGQLKTSILDFSKFLWMNMNGGLFDSVMILHDSTVKLMHSNQMIVSDSNYLNASYGFGWGHIKINNVDRWGHHGRDIGISTEMMYEPDANTGIVIFVNGEDDASTLIPCSSKDDLVCKLLQVSDTIKTEASPELNLSYVSIPCVHEINFWKINKRNWAINALPMLLGIGNYYNQNQVLALLEVQDSSDVSVALAQQLIAAKLNVASGSELSPVITMINEANRLIGKSKLPFRPRGSLTPVESNKFINLTHRLKMYNSGLLNKEKCFDNSANRN